MDYQIELRHLIYFKTLAEELHFRKAAERLFISQPGLSRQIKQMEELYGTKLFVRNQRSVQLTQAGKYLKNEVDELINQLTRIKNQIQKIESEDAITLQLGFIGSAVQTVLPKMLYDIKAERSNVNITLNELSNEIQLEMLLKLELDFGFVRVQDIPNPLQALPVLTEYFSLVVPKDYPIQAPNFISLSDFKDENWILFSPAYSASYYHLVMSIFEDHHFTPNVALKTVNALSIFNLVEQGFGLAIVPTSLQNGYNTQVNFIELNKIPQKTTLYLVWNTQNKNKGIPIFLDILDNN